MIFIILMEKILCDYIFEILMEVIWGKYDIYNYLIDLY